MTHPGSMPRVLITGTGGGAIGEQVYKTLRLSRRACFIIAANADVAMARVVAADGFLQLPSGRAPEYIEAVCGAVCAHAVDFVIPGSEPELTRLVAEAGAIAETGAVLLANSAQVVTTCLDKERTQAALRTCRLPRSGVGAPVWP